MRAGPLFIGIFVRLVTCAGCFIASLLCRALVDRVEWSRRSAPSVEQIDSGDENRYENQKPFKAVHFIPLTFLRCLLFVPSGSIRLPYGQRARRFLPICEAAGRELDRFVQDSVESRAALRYAA